MSYHEYAPLAPVPPYPPSTAFHPFHFVPVVQVLTSSFGLASIPTKNAGAPAASMTSGRVLLEAMAMFRANLAKVKSMEDNRGLLDAPARKLRGRVAYFVCVDVREGGWVRSRA